MAESSDNYESVIAQAAEAAATGADAGLQRAEALYRAALAAGEQALGPFDATLVPALTGLGAVLVQRGALDEARPLLDRAVGIGEQQLGADHPDLAILLNDLTRLYLRHGVHVHAEPLLQRLLQLKRAKGEEHPEVATVLATMATVRQALGRLDEAEQLWRRVVDIRERNLAPNHIATTSALEHLGMACAARGKLTEAVALLQRALVMREVALGGEHPSLRALRERIGDLQLQTSDELLDTGSHVAVPGTAGPRISMTSHLGASLAAPVPAAPVSPISHEQPGGRRSDPRAASEPLSGAAVPASQAPPPTGPRQVMIAQPDIGLSRVVVPAPSAALVPVDATQQSYMDVLLDIKGELDVPEDAPAPVGRISAAFAWATTAMRERRAAMVGAGVLVLVASGVGVAAAVRTSGGPRWVERGTVAPSVPARDTGAAAAAMLADVFKSLTAPEGKDSTHPAPAPTRPRETPARVSDAERSPSPIVIQRNALGRLDSVARSISLPTQSVAESFAVTLQASMANAARSGVEELEPRVAARRARLIGNPPVPHYPDQIARGGIGGEVRIRFDVDTLGRPVLSTLTVVTSPHPSLTASVRKLVPAMRFEPARTPGPAARTITESVEMSFNFAPRGNDE